MLVEIVWNFSFYKIEIIILYILGNFDYNKHTLWKRIFIIIKYIMTVNYIIIAGCLFK